MGQNPPTTQIFNPELRQLRRERAARRGASRTSDQFLLRRAADDAADRIADINRQFQQAVVIGLPVFRSHFLSNVPPEKTPRNITELDDWPAAFPKGLEPDLIISGLVLQSLDDLPQAFVAGRQALVPDGLFISAILGGESLLDLKRACFAVDQEKYGGIVPRVAPMIDLNQGAKLLGLAGLAQPVVDKDVVRVDYRALKTLVEDLRDIGETNHLMAYSPRFGTKAYYGDIEKSYPNKSANGKYVCVYEILWLTGWAPHESQQKPLKPGSAQKKLSDALKEIREEGSE